MKQSTRKTTWFCPGCRKTSRELPPSGLCAHCGDRLAERGYCPVCENHWPLAVGTLCPKHEIELEASEPESAGADSAVSFTKWVEVGRYADALACQPPRIRLEGEGIPTQIDGERMGGISMYPVAIGGVRLRVPEEFAADARIILSQTWSATAKALDIDDWDDFGDDDNEAPPEAVHAPPPPSSLQRAGEFARAMAIRAVLPWLMALFTVLIFGLACVFMWLFRLIGLN